MPDLTYENYFHCSSAENFSTKINGSKGNIYVVRWDNSSHKRRSLVQYDYSCTCKDYEFRNKYCKHILGVIENKLHCNWNQFIDGHKPIRKDDKFYCPKCGAEAIAVRYAV